MTDSAPITYGITTFDQHLGEPATYDALKMFPRYAGKRKCPAHGTAQCVSAKPVSMASMYVWLAVSLIYYGLSLSAGHMGGGGSLHTNFALSMGVEVPGAAATILTVAST